MPRHCFGGLQLQVLGRWKAHAGAPEVREEDGRPLWPPPMCQGRLHRPPRPLRLLYLPPRHHFPITGSIHIGAKHPVLHTHARTALSSAHRVFAHAASPVAHMHIPFCAESHHSPPTSSQANPSPLIARHARRSRTCALEAACWRTIVGHDSDWGHVRGLGSICGRRHGLLQQGDMVEIGPWLSRAR